MKKSFYIKGSILTIVTVILVVLSCNKLDLQPLDRVTTETYYKTASDFDGAIFASYSSIQDFWGTSTETIGEMGEFWKLSLATTDDVAADSTRAWEGLDEDRLLFRASNKPFAAMYTQIYEGILRANLVIENVGGENELTEEQKTQFTAEAKFLRAFFHFLALQMWGTPPLVTEVMKDLNNLAVPNSTKKDLYAAILSDLQDAYAGLPDKWDDANLGRATKWTARAFEGKVDVWKASETDGTQEDWKAAITAFKDVVDNGHYSLMPNYADAFDFQKENGPESIFEIQFGGPFSDDNIWVFDDTHSEAFKASQGTSRVWYWDPADPAPGGHLGWYVPTKNLVDEFEAGDPRLEASVYKDGDTYYTIDNGSIDVLPYDPTWSVTGYSIKKYLGERNAKASDYSGNSQSQFNNERWYRYAEMLLLYAEALIKTGDAAGGLDIINNQIRKRVGLGATPISDPMKALMHEKRVEMAFEPHRWFDITRWKIGAQLFGSKWNDKYNVFPFPQSEIDRSRGLLKQNEGY